MKKILTILFGGVIALTLFVTNGNTAKAAESTSSTDPAVSSHSDCGCNVTILTGAERNKIVSHLLKTDEFKKIKKEYKKQGYTWNGAHDIQVVRNNDTGVVLVGVPFTDPNGNVVMFVFHNGHFQGIAPAN
jgi:hypothetical protein